MIHLALFVISKGLFVIFPPQWMEINAIFLFFIVQVIHFVFSFSAINKDEYNAWDEANY